MEITERAGNYAEGKANEAITKAIAQAYADGYRDGYKDREEEIPVDLRDNKTEYVDLGLPSGTLWSNDYEKENGETLYLPYGKAAKYAIPTEEQWNELLQNCEWNYKYIDSTTRKYDCIGPNGNFITFYSKGFSQIGIGDYLNRERIYFWIMDDCEEHDKSVAFMRYYDEKILKIIKKFMGYKLPVRLVRKK